MNEPGSWRVRVGAEETTATWDPPSAGLAGPVFVCAHGAGGHMGDRLTLATTAALRERGIGTVRFNFLYRERRSARPDTMPKLLECLEAVVARVHEELGPPVMILGGRSMGGRVASVLVSQRPVGNGLLLLAYPLHPAGQPQKLRDAHLQAIGLPVLCINGTRDALCDTGLMAQVVSRLGPNWHMHWIPGADHSFHVLKSSGRTDRDVLTDIAETTSTWAHAL
jgi:hypothetical protein